MKVIILRTPQENEVDGVKLIALTPGRVTDVSPSVGSWLIAEGYAIPEMRAARALGNGFSINHKTRDTSADRPRYQRRRRDDR